LYKFETSLLHVKYQQGRKMWVLDSVNCFIYKTKIDILPFLSQYFWLTIIIMKLKHTLFREGTSLYILFRLYKCFEISLPVDDVKSLLVLRFLKPSTWFFNVRSNHLQNLMNSIQSLINVSVLLLFNPI